MEKFFQDIKASIEAILNGGRIIFYPFAGALIVLPLYMSVRLLLAEPCETLSAQMLTDLRYITNASWSVTAVLFVSSVVVGFLLAIMGFPLILLGLRTDLIKEVEQEHVDTNSFSYNYPLLRKSTDGNYADWLMSEFFRYAEIAAYIPLGGIIGLALIEVYVSLFLLWKSPVGFTGAHTMFLVILGVLAVIKYYVWPEIWAKQVLKPVLRAYFGARRDLIAGVKVIGKEGPAVPAHQQS